MQIQPNSKQRQISCWCRRHFEPIVICKFLMLCHTWHCTIFVNVHIWLINCCYNHCAQQLTDSSLKWCLNRTVNTEHWQIFYMLLYNGGIHRWISKNVNVIKVFKSNEINMDMEWVVWKHYTFALTFPKDWKSHSKELFHFWLCLWALFTCHMGPPILGFNIFW